MQKQLISHSQDLVKLSEEGYQIEVSTGGGHLLVHHIPYLNSAKELKYGTLVAVLNLASPFQTGQPPDHTIFFAGDQPYNANGTTINANSSQMTVIENYIQVQHFYSRKSPFGAYPDYYEKINTYADIFGSQARVLYPSATAKPNKKITKNEKQL